ncbi:MAG: UvrD-helicase domain-containing protein [Planctomycetota bacterium]
MSDQGGLSGLNRAGGSRRHASRAVTGPRGRGTGKTRVITYRIANLIKHGTPPERILAVTFTNKAAREMRRATKLLGHQLDSTPVIATFHSPVRSNPTPACRATRLAGQICHL